jgi:hypothetical protein
MICFYLKGQGIAGYAQVATRPVIKIDSRIPHFEKYTSVFELRNPVECKHPGFDFHDRMQRESLDAIRGNRYTSWAWFIRNPHQVTEHDFRMLTGSQ